MSADVDVVGQERFAVLKRDGFACLICGSKPGNECLIVDRIVSWEKRGSNHPDNLITACDPCAAGRTGDVLLPERIALASVDKDGYLVWKNFGPWNVEACEVGIIINYVPRQGSYWFPQERFYETDWVEHVSRKGWGWEAEDGLEQALDFGRRIIRAPGGHR